MQRRERFYSLDMLRNMYRPSHARIGELILEWKRLLSIIEAICED